MSEHREQREEWAGIRARQRSDWDAVAPGWQANRAASRVVKGGALGTITPRMVAASRVQPGWRIVDLACGIGDPAFTLAELVGPEGSVLGLDISPQMVAAARRWAGENEIENAEFRTITDELNLGAAGVQSGGYDLATCRLGLMFFPDPVAALEGMKEALRPGGRVTVSTWGSPERNPNFTVPVEVIGRHVEGVSIENFPFFAFPDEAAVARPLRAAGLTELQTETFETPVAEAKSAEKFWEGFVRSAGPLVPLLESLPEKQRAAIREETVAAVRRMFPEGPVRMVGEAVVGTGIYTG